MSATGIGSATNKNWLGSSGPVAPESITYSRYLTFFGSPIVGSNAGKMKLDVSDGPIWNSKNLKALFHNQ